jgi:hypothetical protein
VVGTLDSSAGLMGAAYLPLLLIIVGVTGGPRLRDHRIVRVRDWP